MNPAVSFALCPLMAHPITRTPAPHRTCAQEAWTYFSYTRDTGYALFANLGSLSCPQPHSRRHKGDRRKMCAFSEPTLVCQSAGYSIHPVCVFRHFLLHEPFFFAGLHLLISWIIWEKEGIYFYLTVFSGKTGHAKPIQSVGTNNSGQQRVQGQRSH